MNRLRAGRLLQPRQQGEEGPAAVGAYRRMGKKKADRMARKDANRQHRNWLDQQQEERLVRAEMIEEQTAAAKLAMQKQNKRDEELRLARIQQESAARALVEAKEKQEAEQRMELISSIRSRITALDQPLSLVQLATDFDIELEKLEKLVQDMIHALGNAWIANDTVYPLFLGHLKDLVALVHQRGKVSHQDLMTELYKNFKQE